MSEEEVVIGPFTAGNLRQIQDLLGQRGVSAETRALPEIVAHQEREWTSSPSSHRQGATYDPAYTFLILSREGFEQVREPLLKFGIAEPQSLEEFESGLFQEEVAAGPIAVDEPESADSDDVYCCPTCGYSPDLKGFGGMGLDQHPELFCEKHGVPLVRVGVLAKKRKRSEVSRDSFVAGFAILLIAFLVIAVLKGWG